MFKKGLLMTLIDFDASKPLARKHFFFIEKASLGENHLRAFLLAR